MNDEKEKTIELLNKTIMKLRSYIVEKNPSAEEKIKKNDKLIDLSNISIFNNVKSKGLNSKHLHSIICITFSLDTKDNTSFELVDVIYDCLDLISTNGWA